MNDEHLVIVTADASQTIIFIFFICHFRRYITCSFLSKAVQQLLFDKMGEVHHLVTDYSSP